jgi:pimeloyl-ACP methyl ester carboxylesterase
LIRKDPEMNPSGTVSRLLKNTANLTQSHAHIAYRFIPSSSSPPPPSPNTNSTKTTLLYLPGLQSTWTGLKGQTLETISSVLGLNYLTLHYQGHGTSSGTIKEIPSLEEWLSDIEAVLLNTVATTAEDSSNNDSSNLIIVGSSVGGWLALLLSLLLTKSENVLPRIRGLILMAPAVDASQRWSRSSTNQKLNACNGIVSIPSEYVDEGCIQLSQELIDDANERWCLLPPRPEHHNKSTNDPDFCVEVSKKMNANSLLDTLKQNLSKKTLLIDIIAGERDSVVPLVAVEALAENLPGSNLHIVKNGDHRLSNDSDLELLVDIVKSQVASIL